MKLADDPMELAKQLDALVILDEVGSDNQLGKRAARAIRALVKELEDQKDVILFDRAVASAAKKVDLRKGREAGIREAAQTSIDQTHDHPELIGNWNDACDHINSAILALIDKPTHEDVGTEHSQLDP